MNVQRFKRVLDFIKRNPKLWDQETPTPDGPCCFLGRAHAMSRRKLRWGNTWTSSGADWLGLTAKQESYIFMCSRTIKDFDALYRRYARRPAVGKDGDR